MLVHFLDSNLVDNAWAALRKRITAENKSHRTIPCIQTALKEELNTIPEELFDILTY